MKNLLTGPTKCLLVRPQFKDQTFYNLDDVQVLLGVKAAAPPLGLMTLAAFLPDNWELKLVDGDIEPVLDEYFDWADIVMVSGIGPQVNEIREVLKKAKGYYGARRTQIKVARQAVEKAQQYAYRDRKARKRDFRSLWTQRINAAAREHGLTYSRLIDGLTKAGVEVDRKNLSDMAIHQPEAFAAVVASAKAALEYLKGTTPNAFEAAVKS